MDRTRIVVIGNGMVGHRLVELLAGRPDAALAVIAEEPRLAYDRVHLGRLFEDPPPDLALARPEDYAALGVRVVAARATGIDRAARVVRTGVGDVPYDALVLATGSVPFVPPIAGREAAGCFVYRTVEDVAAIRAAAATARAGVVIGGGLLGLEAAGALRRLGLDTHVVEFAPRLMPVQVDEEGGAVLRARIEALGVRVHTATSTEAVLADDAGRVRGVRFASGETVEAQVVVFAVGVRPRDDLARAAGLAVGERGGILIDDACRTSDPDVLAVGECALHGGRVYGLVAPGYAMARVAAAVLVGEDAAFRGADLSTKLKLLGVEVGSFGDAHGATPGARAMSLRDHGRGVYKKLVLSADGARLLGGVLVGDTSDYAALHGLCRDGGPLPEVPQHLLVPPATAGGAAPARPATLCSCENVAASAVEAAVRGGAHDLKALKACTRAGTGCGGCVPLLQDVLTEQLALLGQTVRAGLCEHLPYTRREIFDLVRVHGYRDLESLLAAHGRGPGCEVCKPTVASVLASLWNDHVLDAPLAPLQDSNDAFLANIQRDGTYSVVPRVPGGEITPEGLIALGEVARRFGLYCKITGGQRIDLLGARVEQLPAIWAELVAAGFESGHAYGKALRTVKSCVGQTWCRYGVQDSTALAIRLEERYRGLRAPHKLKGGVSGCARECAEARGKDFGVIATERGWNLYVCGNGGTNPAHARLLAADLDEETLVRSLDRFLMYYVRTADRLQRTSAWLAKLPGGLEYLRAVVMDDHLGLGAELERAMERHVETYRCEWRATLEDPAKLARFRHFVNSDEPDDGVVMVVERHQPRPALPHERDLLPLPMLGGAPAGGDR